MNGPSRERFVHRVDVLLRDTERRDHTGSLAQAATVVAQAVPCLVMDKGGVRVEQYGTQLIRKRVRVLFPDPIELGAEHSLRFVSAAGRVRTLLVDSCRDDTDRGLLTVAECQEEPAPVTTN